MSLRKIVARVAISRHCEPPQTVKTISRQEREAAKEIKQQACRYWRARGLSEKLSWKYAVRF